MLVVVDVEGFGFFFFFLSNFLSVIHSLLGRKRFISFQPLFGCMGNDVKSEASLDHFCIPRDNWWWEGLFSTFLSPAPILHIVEACFFWEVYDCLVSKNPTFGLFLLIYFWTCRDRATLYFSDSAWFYFFHSFRLLPLLDNIFLRWDGLLHISIACI